MPGTQATLNAETRVTSPAQLSRQHQGPGGKRRGSIQRLLGEPPARRWTNYFIIIILMNILVNILLSKHRSLNAYLDDSLV